MKRIASIILTLTLIIGLAGGFAVPSHAATSYDIKICDLEITSDNAFDIDYYLDLSGKASVAGNAYFEPATTANGNVNKLVLSNFIASLMVSNKSYAIETSLDNLTIEVNGKCVLSAHQNPFVGAAMYLTGTDQAITIIGGEEGNHSLTLDGSVKGIRLAEGTSGTVSVKGTSLVLIGSEVTSDIAVTTADSTCFAGDDKLTALTGGLKDIAAAFSSKYANIGPFDISGMKLSFDGDTSYNHSRNIPDFKLNGVTVPDLTYGVAAYDGNCIDAGTNKIALIGKGAYFGTTSAASYEIRKGTFAVDASANAFTFNGSAKEPALKVTDGKRILSEGIEYELSGTPSAVKPGSYVVKVDGIGNYEGSVEVPYTIDPKKAVVNSLTAGKKKLTVKAAAKPAACGLPKYQIGYKVKGTKTWKYTTTTAQSATIKSLKKGKIYQVRIRAYKDSATYGAWSKTVNSKKIK